MFACPHCTARFNATPEIEQQWWDAHFRRFHLGVRAAIRAAQRREAA